MSSLHTIEENKVVNVIGMHQYGIQEWDPVYEQIKKNNSMLMGDQWDDKEKEQLQREGRPTLVLNMELPLVMQLTGLQATNPRSWKVKPIDQYSDIKVADILTRVLDQISVDNDLDFIDEDVFNNGVVGKYGWYYVDMDYEKEVEGRIRIQNIDNMSIMLDPDARSPYQTDWGYLLRRAWLSKEDIKLMFPGKTKDDDFLENKDDSFYERLKDRIKRFLRKDTLNLQDYSHNGKYLVVEKWMRNKRREKTLTDPETGDVYKAPSDQLSIDLYVAQGFEFNDRIVFSVDLQTVFPFALKLLGEGSLEGHYHYPFSLFVPMQFGMPIIDAISYTEPLHGPQEEKNRDRSIISDAIQRSVTSGLILPAGENRLKEELVDGGSDPAFYATRDTSAGNIFQLSQGFPAGLQHKTNANEVDLQRISAQPLAMHGAAESSEESGKLFSARVRQGTISLSTIFGAQTRARRMLGRIVIEFIQAYYTEPRLLRILGKEEGDKDEMIGINMPDPMNQKILNDVSIGRYDISIDDQRQVKNQEEAEFVAWAEILKSLPPQLQMLFFPDFIENSTLPNRREIADRIRKILEQSQQAAGQQPATGNRAGGQGALPQQAAPPSAGFG